MTRAVPVRFPIVLLAAMFCLASLCHAQNWVQSVTHQRTIYVLFDSRIERYDLQDQAWLGATSLPASGAKAISVSDHGVHVAIGANIHRFGSDLGGGSILATAPHPVAQLLMDENVLIATLAAPTGISAMMIPLPGGAPVVSSISTTLDLAGASVAPGRNKLFGRSGRNGPNNIIQVNYSGNRLTTASSSPYTGGVLPNASKTWVFPDDSKVADNAGSIHSTTDLILAGAFGGSLTDLAFRDNQQPVVLRGNRVGLFDAGFRETSMALLSAAALNLHLTTDAAFALIAESSARGVRVERVPFSQFAPAAAAPAVDPAGLTYTPDQILIDRDGVVLLYSAARRTIFRWSSIEKRYLEGIGLHTAPVTIAYSRAEHAIYLGYSGGAISRVAATGGAAELAFANVPTVIRALIPTGSHLLAVHSMFSREGHSTFDLNGNPIDYQARNNSSAVYEYGAGTGKVFWLNDRTTAGILHSAVIGLDGMLGPDVETVYLKPIIRDDPPIRANAAGTKVAIGRGVIFSGSPLKVEHYTLRLSTDMGWVGDTLHSIETRTGGTTTWNRWTSDWNIDRSRVFEGTPLRVLADAQPPVVVTLFGGSPRFYLLNDAGDTIADSVPGRPPVIANQPDNTRADYGGTASFRIHATGSGPFTYEWTKDGNPIADSNSADLVLENCGSSNAGVYQVTVTGPAGSVTSAAVGLGVGPIRNLSPFAVGNLLVCSDDKLHEVRSIGGIVRTLQVPNPYNGGLSHRLDDVAMDRLGRIHVIHRPFQGGNTTPTISTLDPEFSTWTHVKLFSDFSTNSQELDLSVAGDTLITNRMVTMDLATRHVHRMPPIYNTFNRPNLTGGVDGFAYGVESNGRVARFDPLDWTRFETTTVDPQVSLAGAAATADGTIFAVTTTGRLARSAPGTSGQATFLNLPTPAGSYMDFNLSRTGRIAIGGGSTRGIVITSTSMDSSSIITMPEGANTVYVGWVEAPLIPAPTFAATPPDGVLEDIPVVFDPLAGHVDPDAGLTLALAAGPAWLSLDDRGRLVGTPLDEHIGFATVRLTATDRFGASTTMEFVLEVIEVNDTPIATDLELIYPEDHPPFEVDLRTLFEDEETASEDLVYQLISNDNPGLAVVEASGWMLSIAPVQDDFGTAVIIVRATDEGGLTADSEIELTLTPVNDPPVFVTDVPAQLTDDLATPITLELAPYVFDPDPGDVHVWTLDVVSEPAIFSRISLNAESGLLEMVFAPYVSGVSDVTVTVTDEDGEAATHTFQVVLPDLPLPAIELATSIVLNRQTGLFEQRVRLTNTALRDIAGFDLSIAGLPAGASVNNATGSDSDAWIIEHRRVMAPGASVEFIIELFSPQRAATLEPQLAVALVTAPELPAEAAAGGVAVTRLERLNDGALLIEFDSVPGRHYEVNYSDDAAAWKVSPVRIRAAANRVQWIDRGLPRTETHPSEKPSRFYRVREIATPE